MVGTTTAMIMVVCLRGDEVLSALVFRVDEGLEAAAVDKPDDMRRTEEVEDS